MSQVLHNDPLLDAPMDETIVDAVNEVSDMPCPETKRWALAQHVGLLQQLAYQETFQRYYEEQRRLQRHQQRMSAHSGRRRRGF